MKIQCKLCKEICEIGPFRIDGDGIHVTCGQCHEEFYVPSGQEAAAAPKRATAIDGPVMTCPKCELEQPEAEACRQCGLRASRFDGYSAGDGEHNQALAALFEVCEADWDDAEVHERFAAAVSETSAFAYGAKRYRGALRDRPGDATAKKQLDRLARMAEAKLFTAAAARQSEEDVKEPYRAVVILAIVLVLALAAVGYYIMTRTQGGKENNAAQPTTLDPVPGQRTNKRRSSKRRGIDKATPRAAPIPPPQPDKQ